MKNRSTQLFEFYSTPFLPLLPGQSRDAEWVFGGGDLVGATMTVEAANDGKVAGGAAPLGGGGGRWLRQRGMEGEVLEGGRCLGGAWVLAGVFSSYTVMFNSEMNREPEDHRVNYSQ